MHSESGGGGGGGFKNRKLVHYTEEEEGTETTPFLCLKNVYILFNVYLTCSLPSHGDPTRLK